MTTQEVYSSTGVTGYDHQSCWQKDGQFHRRMGIAATCSK